MLSIQATAQEALAHRLQRCPRPIHNKAKLDANSSLPPQGFNLANRAWSLERGQFLGYWTLRINFAKYAFCFGHSNPTYPDQRSFVGRGLSGG